MRARTIASLLVPALLLAAPSFANMGGSSPPPTPTPPESPASSMSEQATPRQQAEREYGDAYDEIAKAKKDLAGSKEKNAEKHFRRALDRAGRAVELDSTYHEAWNLIGFSARHLRDYDRSLAAYNRCLGLKPTYSPAHEYLGEAYLELNQLDKAKEQLAWLESAKAPEATELKTRLDAWLAQHPAPPPAPPPVSAPPDTSTGSGDK